MCYLQINKCQACNNVCQNGPKESKEPCCLVVDGGQVCGQVVPRDAPTESKDCIECSRRRGNRGRMLRKRALEKSKGVRNDATTFARELGEVITEGVGLLMDYGEAPLQKALEKGVAICQQAQVTLERRKLGRTVGTIHR